MRPRLAGLLHTAYFVKFNLRLTQSTKSYPKNKTILYKHPKKQYNQLMSRALTPEVIDVTQAYVESGFSIEATSDATGLDPKSISEIIQHPQAKSYLNEIYLDTGYRNKARLGRLLDRLIESKIEEAEESDMWTDMDLADLIKLAHKMRVDEAKLDANPSTQVNIANFGESKYADLVNKLLSGKNS